jgi:hypothetical protein
VVSWQSRSNSIRDAMQLYLPNLGTATWLMLERQQQKLQQRKEQ